MYNYIHSWNKNVVKFIDGVIVCNYLGDWFTIFKFILLIKLTYRCFNFQKIVIGVIIFTVPEGIAVAAVMQVLDQYPEYLKLKYQQI